MHSIGHRAEVLSRVLVLPAMYMYRWVQYQGPWYWSDKMRLPLLKTNRVLSASSYQVGITASLQECTYDLPVNSRNPSFLPWA